jgi:AcrR family transcriptional regulator
MTAGSDPDRSDESPPRSRQKRVGDALRRETRSRLLDAAGIEFARHGYTGTTVARIAATAGVSVQTLYLACGSKRELLRGYMERALAGQAASPEDAAAQFIGLAPRALLERLADVVAEVAERAALGWRLYQDASAVDPEIAEDWNELQLLRRGLFARILAGIPDKAFLDGLTRETAVDTVWAIASPDTHDLLVRRLGYDLDAFRHWMRDTLPRAILRAR